MAKFYNLADQKLFEKYQFLPQEQYRLGLNLPTDPVPDPVVDQGIVNTDSFANSGGGGDGFNAAGNMFGEGTAVNPGDSTVITEGPYSGQSGYYGSVNYSGGLPGNITQKGPGRQFTGDEAMVGDPRNYSKGAFDSLESEEEKKGFLARMMNSFRQKTSNLPDWAKKGLTAAGMITAPIPTLLSKIFGGGRDGPQYGIAGLTDKQKGLYNNLAANNYLYQTPSGYKTFDGKNFSQVDEETYENYFDNKIDRFGSLEEYEDYLDEEPDLRKNLRKVYDYNKIGYTGLTGNDDIDDARQKQSDAIIKNEMLIREIRKAAAKRKNEDKDSSTTDNNTTDNTGTVSTTSPDYTPVGPNQPDPSNNNNNNNDGGVGEGPSNRGRNSSQPGGGFNSIGFSDIRLKENVELIGKSPSNINIYKFNYKDSPTTYQGAMAHEVPWASVQHSNGYMMIDYSKIDVKLKKI